MIKHKKVLVAFDGAEFGLKALDIAKKMTIDNNAQLTVAYVHGSPFEHPLSIGTTPAGENYMFQQYIATGSVTGTHLPDDEKTIILEEEIPEQVMALAKTKLGDLQHVTYEKLVGKAAKVLVEYANTNDIDLIIIGNRGIGGFQKLVMGSVSEKVSNHAKCSVYIVK